MRAWVCVCVVCHNGVAGMSNSAKYIFTSRRVHVNKPLNDAIYYSGEKDAVC